MVVLELVTSHSEEDLNQPIESIGVLMLVMVKETSILSCVHEIDLQKSASLSNKQKD